MHSSAAPPRVRPPRGPRPGRHSSMPPHQNRHACAGRACALLSARQRWGPADAPQLMTAAWAPIRHSAGAHQLPAHDLALVHQVVDEAVFLPVQAVDLPGHLRHALPLVIFVHGILHLLLKVLYHLLYQLPALWGTLVLELAFQGAHVCGRAGQTRRRPRYRAIARLGRGTPTSPHHSRGQEGQGRASGHGCRAGAPMHVKRRAPPSGLIQQPPCGTIVCSV